jgi:oxygen-independent coproporphyrinogen-3 oxidase
MTLAPPPLSLYVHFPWCVSKCPYCDFNSHAVKGSIPRDEYVEALLIDLEQDLPLVWGRPVHSVFFGGGTPSLFSASQIERVISGLRCLLQLSPDAEITLEANPGTTEHDSFAAYRDAGVNRVSLGAQSFSDEFLTRIGRIHGRVEVDRAVESVHSSGIENFNLDLMYGLPGQSLADALDDVRLAISCAPTHLSHYQLTLEPNTAFHARPPVLPGEDLGWEMQKQGGELLAGAGYRQYEISAWALPGQECRQNLNYWQYGDYLGIGAGAHGKITRNTGSSPSTARDAARHDSLLISRRVRHRHPRAWMDGVRAGAALAEDRQLLPEEKIFEFFLNQLRLREGVKISQFAARTGLDWDNVEEQVGEAIERGLLSEENGMLVPTELGWRFSNETQAIFLP